MHGWNARQESIFGFQLGSLHFSCAKRMMQMSLCCLRNVGTVKHEQFAAPGWLAQMPCVWQKELLCLSSMRDRSVLEVQACVFWGVCPPERLHASAEERHKAPQAKAKPFEIGQRWGTSVDRGLVPAERVF